jgi:hypothetical protein
MAGKFLERMAGHFANETAVVTPNARILSASPEEGLAKWEKLPEADRKTLEDFGRYDPKLDPVPPPGGLILRVFARGLARAPDGRLEVYRNPKAHLSREAGRDFLWMTRAEWQSLVPAEPRPGQRRAVPAPLVDRVCRRYLIDLVRVGGEGGPRGRADTLHEELTLTVESADADRVRLRLDGSAAFRTHGPEHGAPGKEGRADAFRLLGFLDYEARKQAFTRFDVVALSETGHFDEAARKVLPLGVAFELTRGDTPADRTRPHSLHDDYFGKAK